MTARNQQQNYFELFGFPPSFDIDLSELEKRYFLVQRQFHPDRMIGKSAYERTMAISMSMTINTAYETLRQPLKRIQYLLVLSGMADSARPSQELLMETMELREQLAETSTQEELGRLEAQNTHEKENVIAKISQAVGSRNFSQAAELAMRLSYLNKMADEILGKRKIISQ